MLNQVIALCLTVTRVFGICALRLFFLHPLASKGGPKPLP